MYGLGNVLAGAVRTGERLRIAKRDEPLIFVVGSRRDPQCEPDAVGDAELAKDPGQMSLDGPLCDAQLARDLLVAFTAADVSDDLPFTLG